MNPSISRACHSALFALALGALAGCGSSNYSPTANPLPNTSNNSQTSHVNVLIGDDSTDDWALVGVKIQSIALIPQGGGSNVTVYTAPSPAPMVNLVQMDAMSDLLANATVPAGNYNSAVVTIGANPGDVALTVANDPEAGFAGTPGASIPPSQIQISGATGAAGSMTASFNVRLQTPLNAGSTASALDIDFDLSHPAFIVDHTTAAGTIWTINFNGPVRHHAVHKFAEALLRDLYGSSASVNSGNTSLTMTKVLPVLPPTSPETAASTSASLTINADATNGTIYYDVDAKTKQVIKDFSSLANNLNGKYLRVTARYQPDGSLYAVRVWSSSSFNSIWLSPEGHVLHVNTTSNTITVQNEAGSPVTLNVDANTQFFYRTPTSATNDGTPIATGTNFLTTNGIVRGFKVHASVVDPLATPLVAQTIDIEDAKFDGSISNPTTTNFTYTRNFATASDDYQLTLPYIASGSSNGTDANGNAVTGFKWWNFTYPTTVTTGSTAITSFVAATNGSASFGGTVGAINAWGESYGTWNDPANPNGWSAMWTILMPAPLPLGSVATPYIANSTGGSFGMTVVGGTNTVNIDVSNVTGSATLVYQIDKTGAIVTVGPVDLTSTAGQTTISGHLAVGEPVKVFGVPQADGSVKAYALFYYTGTLPQ